MRNKLNKRILAGIGIVSAFILLLVALLASYYLGPGQSPDWFRPFIQYHVEFMVALALVGILVGMAIAYLAFDKVEEKTAESKINAEMLLSFLSADEKKTIQYLIDNGGRAYQNEISRIDGMSRLRAHRVVQKLSEKSILEAERHGKANKLKLAEPIFDALKPAQ